MKETEHNEKTPCCWIVGAGPCGGLHAEGFAPKKEDYIIAADGGLRYLEDAGVSPDMVVGDFDTLGYEPEHENVVRLSVTGQIRLLRWRRAQRGDIALSSFMAAWAASWSTLSQTCSISSGWHSAA